MAEILFREPHLTDVGALVAHMRQADIAECHAVGRTDIRTTVERSIGVSVWSKAVLIDNEVAAIFGVAPLRGMLLTDTGVPWLLGTDALTRHRGAFIRQAPTYIAAMLKQFPRLTNFVHAENAAAVRWLKRAGFALADAKPRGPHGALFHEFTMERKDV